MNIDEYRRTGGADPMQRKWREAEDRASKYRMQLDLYPQIVREAVEAKREACAKVCEDSVEYAGDTLAAAIRARKEKK